ncbi:type III pantothenate kinase [bacterium BMS3Abin07]|nr:type III pantothenate kinase [bacterium BMS3Abin07]GBE32622.1 type III pantothenate kinase [bacterium BMS3Bbin05]HDL21004.1 type III pantothenate kinase [Nitrospirota bacterium]HDO23231.1 type III pantothenate kinase [Nitrospirota bacterium]
MVIALDIGNSRIKSGVRNGDDIVMTSTLTHPVRDAGSYLDELGLSCPADSVIISSVVECLNGTFRDFSPNPAASGVIFVDYRSTTGITFKVSNPELVGSDRIANAVGGYSAVNGPVIIVDMGSATTLTVVGKGCEFLGGCIMPGVNMMAASLHEETSKLPVIDFIVPEHAIGSNTVESIRAGLSFGVAGAVERMIDEIRMEIGYTMNVILTGGLCERFQGLVRGVDIIDPLITIRGLFEIHDKAVM